MALELEGYDYFDFGCSTGANIALIKSICPRLRGLGIDVDGEKVAGAIKQGHEAIVYDILSLPARKTASFVTMSHFLEHLASVDQAARMIRKAVSVSRDFVFIRQPWFDSDGMLLGQGLKFFWSHWHGHRNKMTSLDFHGILTRELSEGRIRGFSIHGRTRITHSNNSTLLPLSAPMDQHHYDASLHGQKVEEPVRCPAFREIVVLARIGPVGMADALMQSMGAMEALYQAGSQE